ncbi:hypothetical protein D1AOALGA4SA_11079 [Olavius algarvensis Delta 1 endosymbiont]|nr:hypothetical protein D1AOALGA4SA_11079 [Olavius algarvensis Delta 1 endosymbiont]
MIKEEVESVLYFALMVEIYIRLSANSNND